MPNRRETIVIRHACGHVATYPRPANDPNGDIATGLAMQVCTDCETKDEDWMDVLKRGNYERTDAHV